MDSPPKIVAMRRAVKLPVSVIEVEDLSLWYGDRQVLDHVSFDVRPGQVLALAGPTGSGKSTALKCLNRMHDGTPDVRTSGHIRMAGQDVLGEDVQPVQHRRRFGWLDAATTPLPISVYENLAYGARQSGRAVTRDGLATLAETCLRRVRLWGDVKGDLHDTPATALSAVQQRQMCLARMLAGQPDVLLMDDPTGGLQPDETDRVEDLIRDLSGDHAIVVAARSPGLVQRVADRVGLFRLGRLVELEDVGRFFHAPRTPEARTFVKGQAV